MDQRDAQQNLNSFHFVNGEFPSALASIGKNWTIQGMRETHHINESDAQKVISLPGKIHYLLWEAIIMVVGEATFVAARPLVFGHFAAQIKMQEGRYIYILALRDVQPYMDIVKFIAGESASELFKARVRTMRKERASLDRAEIRLLHHLARLQKTGNSGLPEGQIRTDPIRHFCGTTSGYSMALGMGIPWIHLVISLPEVMMMKFGFNYAMFIPNMLLETVAYDDMGWIVLSVVLDKQHHFNSTCLKMASMPNQNHYRKPDLMSVRIEDGCQYWVNQSRQSQRYVVTPTCEPFSEVQMCKAPNERRPKMNMDSDLHTRLNITYTKTLSGKIAPSVEIIYDSISPWWIARDCCHGILVPMMDSSVLNMAFDQYYISECPIHATVTQHLELSARSTLYIKFKELKANPLGITQRRAYKESLTKANRSWDRPLNDNTLISGLKDPASLLSLFKKKYPECHLITLPREGSTYLYLRFASDWPSWTTRTVLVVTKTLCAKKWNPSWRFPRRKRTPRITASAQWHMPFPK